MVPKNRIFVFPFAVVLMLLQAASPQKTVSAETVRLPSVRDTWVSSVDGEESGNNGAASRLKLKGYQEFSLIDFDLSPVKGRKIEKATLHLKLGGEERLYRVGVSTLSADWVEGTGKSYDKEPGSSSFRWQANFSTPWTTTRANVNGYSDLTSVMFSEGGTFWSSADASEPVDGWQSIEIDPKIVAARTAGISYGFVLFDDTGTELIRNGEDVTIRIFPNRFVYSRDQNASVTPWLELRLADDDHERLPPEKPSNIRIQTKGLPPGEAVVQWDIPPLEKSDTLGFMVKLDHRDVPRFMIPVPSFSAAASQSMTMRLRDLGLAPGAQVQIEIQAVNASGVVSEAATASFCVSKESLMQFPGETPALTRKSEIPSQWTPQELSKRLPHLGMYSVSILDELDKVTEDGHLIPDRPDSYFAFNHLWDASKKQIHLHSAKNEWIGFQIHLDTPDNREQQHQIAASLTGNQDKDKDDPLTGCRIRFYRFGYVESPRGKIADPLLPLDSGTMSLSKRDTIYCEMFVSPETSSGEHHGTLQIELDGGKKLLLDVALTVWNFALPNELGFFPEMNCYDLPSNELDYYRLAQLHRTYINRVPYSHRGTVAQDCAPIWNKATQTFDWSAWDKRYSGLFDGSAFAGLPRGAVPVEAFYLPLFENFPADIFQNYNGNDWADQAFSPEYVREFRNGCREFAKHVSSQKWNQTCFQFFLNNKMDYKRDGWSRASSPWLMDEPASYRDFAALQFFGRMFLESTQACHSPIRFRCDISRPQWQRDSLDGIMGVYVVGGAFVPYNQMVNDRKKRFGQLLYVYGTTCPPEEGAVQPVAWSWDAWTRGADGIVPWQTIGTKESWTTSDPLALFYPNPEENGPETSQVIASHRLKAYRRGQQDIEYLIQLMKATGTPRWNISQAVRAELNLDSENTISHPEDAGTMFFKRCRPEDFQRLRTRAASCLESVNQ
ncbi:MAG: DUF4091 domain-containing protein [Planctomycetaceae bacterium]|nr:DUF4091 domain-containing protein [Planctomycetaceae bacterium]